MAYRHIGGYYDCLKQGNHLTEDDCNFLQNNSGTLHQLASLSVLLARRSRTISEEKLLSWILSRSEVLYDVIHARYFKRGNATKSPDWLITLFCETYNDGNVGSELINLFVREFTSGSLTPDIVSAWLMVVCMEGLSWHDTKALTRAMTFSGSIFDYRNEPLLKDYKLIRRYPTGALSEKTALILPSLLAAAHSEYKVASPFLVARSLGFTGGTWDKLSAIPDFEFPLPGDASIEALLNCGVSMSVTKGSVAPADRLMYQLRSVTGTVESEALIVASIASKQLALPVDALLMDVRYGDGAFINSQESAELLTNKLIDIITSGGVPTYPHFTDTKQPGGASIGNALEVAEAISILGGGSSDYWDSRWLYEQKALAIDFFCKLMSLTNFDIPIRAWSKIAACWLDDGTALSGFKSILQAHNVPETVIDKLLIDPIATLNVASKPVAIKSEKDGYLLRFAQRDIGYFVNDKLGGGGNEYSGELKANQGIVLAKRIGDVVKIGDPLCYVFSSSKFKEELSSILRDCFVIESSKSIVRGFC